MLRAHEKKIKYHTDLHAVAIVTLPSISQGRFVSMGTVCPPAREYARSEPPSSGLSYLSLQINALLRKKEKGRGIK